MLDFATLLLGLNKNHVKYIVVGGIAVNLYGIPRMTYDLDLILKLDDENLNKFVKLMKKWKYKPKVPVDVMDFAKKEKRDDWIKNKNMKTFCLKNIEAPVKEIDIIIDSSVNYKNAIKNVKKIKLQGTTIPIIGIKDLIRMKKITNRKQDCSDIRYLEERLGEE